MRTLTVIGNPSAALRTDFHETFDYGERLRQLTKSTPGLTSIKIQNLSGLTDPWCNFEYVKFRKLRSLEIMEEENFHYCENLDVFLSTCVDLEEIVFHKVELIHLVGTFRRVVVAMPHTEKMKKLVFPR